MINFSCTEMHYYLFLRVNLLGQWKKFSYRFVKVQEETKKRFQREKNTKVQLISKGLFGVLKSTKKPMDFF